MNICCEQCGKPRLTANKFCGQCGKKFDSAPFHTKELVTPNLDAYHALRKKIQLDAQNKNTKRLTAIAIGTVSVPAYIFYTHGNVSWEYVLGVCALTFFIAAVTMESLVVKPNRYLYKSEYYKLPGSGGNNENHRCIFCGNKGIWRQGQYATSATYADCSTCKSELFSE